MTKMSETKASQGTVGIVFEAWELSFVNPALDGNGRKVQYIQVDLKGSLSPRDYSISESVPKLGEPQRNNG